MMRVLREHRFPRTHSRGYVSKQVAVVLTTILIAVLLRGLYLAEFSRAPDFRHPAVDARFHDEWARYLAFGSSGSGASPAEMKLFEGPFLRPPGYPYFLALVYRIAGASYFTPRFVQAMLGIVNMLIAFAIGRRWFGSGAGLVAALLMASHWLLIYYEAEFHAPVLIIFLVLSSMYTLGSWAGDPRIWKAGAGGFILGLAVLVRPNILLFLPAVLVWMVLVRRGHHGGRQKLVPLLTVTVLCMIAPISPATLHNYRASGDFIPVSTNGGINLYIGNNPHATGLVAGYLPGLGKFETCFDYPRLIAELERQHGRHFSPADVSSWFTGRALRWIGSNPGRFLSLTLAKAALFWGPEEIAHNKVVALEREHSKILRLLPISFPLLLGLAVMGLVVLCGANPTTGVPGRFRDRTTREVTVLILIFIVTWFLSVLPFFAASRYRVPVLPALILLAGCGVVGLAKFILYKYFRRAAFIAFCGACAALVASANPYGYEQDTTKWHMDRGRAFRLEGRMTSALEEFREATEISPAFADARFELANLLAATGDTAQAVESYRRALETDPSHLPSLNNLGTILAQRGDTDEAIELWHRALAIDPSSLETRFNRGLALEQSGRLEEAAEEYRKVLELRPGFPPARRSLERVLQTLRGETPGN